MSRKRQCPCCHWRGGGGWLQSDSGMGFQGWEHTSKRRRCSVLPLAGRWWVASIRLRDGVSGMGAHVQEEAVSVLPLAGRWRVASIRLRDGVSGMGAHVQEEAVSVLPLAGRWRVASVRLRGGTLGMGTHIQEEAVFRVAVGGAPGGFNPSQGLGGGFSSRLRGGAFSEIGVHL